MFKNLFLVALFVAMFFLMILNIVFRKVFHRLKEKYLLGMDTLELSEAWVLRSGHISKTAVGFLEDYIRIQYGNESQELSDYMVFERLYFMYRSFDIVTIIVFIIYMIYQWLMK